KYYKKFGDAEFIKENIHYLEAVLQAHTRGTRYNIHVTEQGFLYGGEGLAQLTWMDARIGDYVVTPRHGCPVEIQALWYNALR
ncbi:MAG: glycogen debranching protein, partial [Bacteroidetes bacterium CG_4_10_14_3_um_filter_42_6]